MRTLEQLNTMSNDYIRLHWNNGGSSEFDHSINEISIEKINAYNTLHKRIWLVKVNRYDDIERSEPFLVEYVGQHIYNRAFSFAVHDYDQKLIDLLSEYEKPLIGPYNSKECMNKINAIFDRAQELGAIFFQWS